MTAQPRTLYISALSGLALCAACVPARKFEEVKTQQEQCEVGFTMLKNHNEELIARITELNQVLSNLTKRYEGLVTDTAVLGKSLRLMKSNYDALNETYELLLKNNKEMLAGSRTEADKLREELQNTLNNLLKQQDSLNLFEGEKEVKPKEGEKSSFSPTHPIVNKSGDS
ncbi:MAG: hypothetical protein H6585_15480 [Flavobacteriales bacterium]|nr:hypothetical protein [Flavobacteriales bacterium]MCB9449732.1 hypothetical protein [Flavobacteriales bacterium]